MCACNFIFHESIALFSCLDGSLSLSPSSHFPIGECILLHCSCANQSACDLDVCALIKRFRKIYSFDKREKKSSKCVHHLSTIDTVFARQEWCYILQHVNATFYDKRGCCIKIIDFFSVADCNIDIFMTL